MDYEFQSDSFEIDISRIKDSDKICWQYTSQPPVEEEEEWFEATGDFFCKLSPVTQALATSSDFVHLQIIKPSNLMEWFYRLDALYDAGVGFLYSDTPEGEVPIRLNINDLKDHIGLKIDTGYWEKQKFDKTIRNLRMMNNLRGML